ncbi:Transcriptional activator FeaR [Frondihabitans sp. 762G35]|uniref:AraC family transcriptional regulator n=1 Tax=Frondihabitans sp. 762G35 TaxID=1446794 RepID=UPI000D21CD45|nr:AraC family transcriptional regulator [Frondihabitans sp. 762G35]ARC56646.1 Transcriptional activator FeaR [Frondihabitans sp. 762G35]
MQATTFSTRHVTSGDPVAEWEAHNARSLVGLSCLTPRSGRFDAVETNARLGSFDVAHVVATPHAVARRTSHIAGAAAGDSVLYLTRRGSSTLTSRWGSIRQDPGSITLCPIAEPFSRRFAEGVDELVVRIPHAVAETVASSESPARVRLVDGGRRSGTTPASRSLDRFLGAALAAPDRASATETAAELTTRLRLLLTPGFDRSAEGRRFVIVDHVDEHLHDRELTVESVAASQGLSERQVRRLFAGTGAGLAETILGRRLDLAHRILRGEEDGPATVAGVADRCGFASHAHFTRAFRARFDRRPVDVLSERLAAV